MKTLIKKPLITNIHRFALDDGPGIRTTVFFKGCPLSCIWCHNPETISTDREITFHSSLCIGCGDCLKACPQNAIGMGSPERIDRNRCTVCGACTDVCPSTALRKAGMYYTPVQLVNILLKDCHYFETSSGGITFSGGEPTLNMEYLGTVSELLKKRGIHIALQTCGYFDWITFQSVLLPYLDLVYFDLKLFDPALHKKWTSKSNELIFLNFVRIIKSGRTVVIPRIPLIPGITSTKENLSNFALFLKKNNCPTCEFLPFNSGGILKRTCLGKPRLKKLLDLHPDITLKDRCETFFRQQMASLRI